MAEDMINPMLRACDVALTKQFHIHNFDPNAVITRLESKNKPLQNFVARLFPSGSCFILSKPRGNIMVENKKIIALAVTNFHAAYDMGSRKKNELFAFFDELRASNIMVENKKIIALAVTNFHAAYDMGSRQKKELFAFFDEFGASHYTNVGVLFELYSRYPSSMISISIDQSYCYPSDVAIPVIYDFPGASELLEFLFASEQEINEAKSAFILGHPCTSDYEYVLPTKEPGDDEKIVKAFHEFKYQVNSFGSILNHCESGLLELELSATTGMSGSPMLLGKFPQLKIEGIYCGDPPIIG